MNKIIKCIMEAENKYNSDNIDIIIDYDNNDIPKVFVMYHDKHNSFAINTFDYDSTIDEDELEYLCDKLDLGFDNYL